MDKDGRVWILCTNKQNHPNIISSTTSTPSTWAASAPSLGTQPPGPWGSRLQLGTDWASRWQFDYGTVSAVTTLRSAILQYFRTLLSPYTHSLTHSVRTHGIDRGVHYAYVVRYNDPVHTIQYNTSVRLSLVSSLQPQANVCSLPPDPPHPRFITTHWATTSASNPALLGHPAAAH